MIKIFFAMITMFWILGISQGYVLQGSQDMIEIEAQFTIRNRRDIGSMMKLASTRSPMRERMEILVMN